MKKIKIFNLLALTLMSVSLSSCGILNSATKLPGSLLQLATRTAGLAITESGEKDERVEPSFEVIDDGYINQLD